MSAAPVLPKLRIAMRYILAIVNSKARAGGHCDVCGIERNTYRRRWEFDGTEIAQRVKLSTFHMDGSPANNAARNLKQLCQACHLEAARQFNRERQLALFDVQGRLTTNV